MREPTRPCLVLMYHAVHDTEADTGATYAEERGYALTRDEFRRDLDGLAASRHRIVSPAALGLGGDSSVEPPAPDPYDDDDSCDVLLSFDDSWRSHATLVADELAARKFSAIFFLTPGQVGGARMLEWQHIADLRGKGFAIGAHGMSHRFLSSLPLDALREELAEARHALAEAAGRSIAALSLPGGRGGRREVAEARRLGYAHVFGSRPGFWTTNAAPPFPRVAVHGGEDGRRRVRALLENPARTCRRLAKRYALLAAGKMLLGDTLYHSLHGRFARWTGNRNQGAPRR